jgi:hypothetical protein
LRGAIPFKEHVGVCFPRLNDLSHEDLKALERLVDAEVVVQGGRSKPTLRDTLLYQLLMIPINTYKVAHCACRQWVPVNPSEHGMIPA